jgi:hypothetical protein
VCTCSGDSSAIAAIPGSPVPDYLMMNL